MDLRLFLLAFFFTYQVQAEEQFVLIPASSGGNGNIQLLPGKAKSPTENIPDLETMPCELFLTKEKKVTVISEQAGYLEVKFPEPIFGCYAAFGIGSYFSGIETAFISKTQLIFPEEKIKKAPIAIKVKIPSENDEALPPDNYDCPEVSNLAPTTSQRPRSRPDYLVAQIEEALRVKQAGFKSPALIDKYLRCYPYGPKGQKNYEKYSKYIDIATDVFSTEKNGIKLKVNPSLMRCLIRRESGYDPQAGSHTGAEGLGQHTDINIKEINRLINTDGSWEQTQWRAFFKKVKATEGGAELLQKCMGSTSNGRPVFGNEDDARCPLQSIAASFIYNLHIQGALMRKSEEDKITFSEEMNYQLAIAAAYNLGITAASNAVEEKNVMDWMDAIVKKSQEFKDPEKDEEVKSHVRAIRNCLEAENWKPMNPSDPQIDCKDF